MRESKHLRNDTQMNNNDFKRLLFVNLMEC